MARHLTITGTLGTPVYFYDSQSPSPRGSNESTNGLLRDHFPKGNDLRIHTAEHLLAVENELVPSGVRYRSPGRHAGRCGPVVRCQTPPPDHRDAIDVRGHALAVSDTTRPRDAGTIRPVAWL